MSITPLQTAYRGYHFRSRLEARYAVLFDHLGIKWDYEPEGYRLPDGTRYLPDFFIHMRDRTPGWGYWIEIKGVEPSERERAKLQALATMTGHHGWLYYGSPAENAPELFDSSGPLPPPSKAYRAFMKLVGARKRSAEEQFFSSAPIMLCCEDSAMEPGRFDKAIIAARSARFEHGESGATL